jgi:3-hydroxyisobutyrate dehydrogenase-like beta-hydroxyacid dehydrogenase
MNVAFLGLGVMGYPMAGHLVSQGHSVTVYNRTAKKAEEWAASHGGQAAETPRAAAVGQDIVFACVGNDDDVRSITLGEDGAFAGMSEGCIFVDHTTASAEVARELAEVASLQHLIFMDAPVSGGQQGTCCTGD